MGLSLLVATSAHALTTNVLQNINITITGFSDGVESTNATTYSRSVNKIKKSTADIIQIIGNAMTNTFSKKSKLVLINNLAEEGDATVYVVDGTNRVDVSGFFSYDQPTSTDVQSYSSNFVSHVEKSIDYSIANFSLKDSDGYTLQTHFQSIGSSTITAASVVKSGVVLGKARQIALDLHGIGDYTDNSGSHDMVVHVVITITGNTVLIE